MRRYGPCAFLTADPPETLFVMVSSMRMQFETDFEVICARPVFRKGIQSWSRSVTLSFALKNTLGPVSLFPASPGNLDRRFRVWLLTRPEESMHLMAGGIQSVPITFGHSRRH